MFICYYAHMKNKTQIQNLKNQINTKNELLLKQINLVSRYEKSIGRDRWFNRGCQTIMDLKSEIIDLKDKLENIEKQ